MGLMSKDDFAKGEGWDRLPWNGLCFHDSAFVGVLKDDTTL